MIPAHRDPDGGGFNYRRWIPRGLALMLVLGGMAKCSRSGDCPDGYTCVPTESTTTTSVVASTTLDPVIATTPTLPVPSEAQPTTPPVEPSATAVEPTVDPAASIVPGSLELPPTTTIAPVIADDGGEAAAFAADPVAWSAAWLADAWTWNETTSVEQLRALIADRTGPALLATIAIEPGVLRQWITVTDASANADGTVTLAVRYTAVTEAQTTEGDQVVTLTIASGVVTGMVVS